MIWVCGGTLFYLFESSEYLQPIEDMRDSFDSVPSAMYFLCIFLGGEWGLTDFSAPGKILCIALVLIGIELYAMNSRAVVDDLGLDHRLEIRRLRSQQGFSIACSRCARGAFRFNQLRAGQFGELRGAAFSEGCWFCTRLRFWFQLRRWLRLQFWLREWFWFWRRYRRLRM